MGFRYATRGDTQGIKRLWHEAFPDDDGELFFSKEYAPEKTIVYAADGEILSMFHLQERSLWFNGVEIPACYLLGGATDSRFRGKGLFAGLIERIVADLDRLCIPLAFLIPAGAGLSDYYKRFGFMDCCSLVPVGGHKVIHKAGKQDYQRILELYNSCFSSRLVRTELDFELIAQEYGVYITDKGYIVKDGRGILEQVPPGERENVLQRALIKVIRPDLYSVLDNLNMDNESLEKPYINLLHN